MKGENDTKLEFRAVMGINQILFVLSRSQWPLRSGEEQLGCDE